MQTVRDLVADMAGEAGFESFEDTPCGINGYVQETLLDASLLNTLLADFPISEAKITYTLAAVESQDWNEVWEREGFAPIDIEDKVVIYDAKAPKPEAPTASTLMIGIDARQAFGTGTHETTQMIVGTLSDMNLVGKSVLDCGTGTGILAIAAVKMGATRCVAYDIDEWSVDNARHNALLNEVGIEVLLGDARLTETMAAPFDVVLANINRNILLADMAHFERVMAQGGTLVLSGFYPADVALLEAKANKLGLHLCQQKSNGDWACMVLCKS